MRRDVLQNACRLSLMTRSAETYLGPMATDLVRRVEQASDETQLLSVVGHWHMAMRDAKHGKDVASTLLEQIKANFAQSGHSQIEQ
jgi:IMP cyclohydrolase